MKKVLIQLGKALCYFLLFFGMQLICSVVIMLYHSVMLGLELGMSGQMPDEYVIEAMLMERVMNASTLLVIVAAALTILAIWLFFKIRRKKWTVESGFRKMPGKTWLLAIMAGLGMGLFFNGGLSLLPFPEELLASYEEASVGLTNQPLWIMLLSNVIAAPFVEEITFRGLMFSRLRKAMPLWVVILITSFVFGLMHGQLLWIAYATIMGALFAVIAVKTGSLWASVTAHMVVNLMGTILSEISWMPTVAELGIMCGVGAVVIVGVMYLLFSAKNNGEQADIAA